MSDSNADILVRGLIDCGTHGALFDPKSIRAISTHAKKIRFDFSAATPEDIEFVRSHVDAILILDCYTLRVKGHVPQADKNLKAWMKFFKAHKIQIGTIYGQCFHAIFLNMDGKLFDAERAANRVMHTIASTRHGLSGPLLKLAEAVAQFVLCATQFELRRFETLPDLLHKTQAMVPQSRNDGGQRQLATCVRAGVNLYRGKLFVKRSNFTEAEKALDLAEADYRSIRSLLGPSDVAVERARLAYQIGDFERTIAYLKTCEETYQKNNAIDRLVGTLNFVARALFKIGRDSEAEEKIHECRRLWSQYKMPQRWLLNKNYMLATETLGRLHLLNLALPEAEKELIHAAELAEAMQLHQEVGYCHTWLAAVYRKTRRLDRAILSASTAKDLFQTERLPDKAYVYADMELTLAMLLANEFDKGYVFAHECLERAATLKNIHLYGDACAEIALALCKVGQFNEALSFIHRGEEWINKYRDPGRMENRALAHARTYCENFGAIELRGDTIRDTPHIINTDASVVLIHETGGENMQRVRDHVAFSLPQSVSGIGHRLSALDVPDPSLFRYVLGVLKYEYEPSLPSDDRMVGFVQTIASFLERMPDRKGELECVLTDFKLYEKELRHKDRVLKKLRDRNNKAANSSYSKTCWLEMLVAREQLASEYASTDSITDELRNTKAALIDILPDDWVDSFAYARAPIFGKLLFLLRHAGINEPEVSVILDISPAIVKGYLAGSLLWGQLERSAQLSFNELFIVLGNSFRTAERDPFEIRRYWQGPLPLDSCDAGISSFKELLMKNNHGLEELLSVCRDFTV